MLESNCFESMLMNWVEMLVANSSAAKRLRRAVSASLRWVTSYPTVWKAMMCPSVSNIARFIHLYQVVLPSGINTWCSVVADGLSGVSWALQINQQCFQVKAAAFGQGLGDPGAKHFPARFADTLAEQVVDISKSPVRKPTETENTVILDDGAVLGFTVAEKHPGTFGFNIGFFQFRNSVPEILIFGDQVLFDPGLDFHRAICLQDA